MQDDARMTLGRPPRRDVDSVGGGAEKTPELRSARVAEERALPTGQGRSHPPALLREPPVAYGVHASVQAVHAPANDPALDRARPRADRDELPMRDDPMLPRRNIAHLPVTWAV